MVDSSAQASQGKGATTSVTNPALAGMLLNGRLPGSDANQTPLGQKYSRDDEGEEDVENSKRRRIEQDAKDKAAGEEEANRVVGRNAVDRATPGGPKARQGLVNFYQLGQEMAFGQAKSAYVEHALAARSENGQHPPLLGNVLLALTQSKMTRAQMDQLFYFKLSRPQLSNLAHNFQMMSSMVFGRMFGNEPTEEQYAKLPMRQEVKLGVLVWCPFIEPMGDQNIGVECLFRVYTIYGTSIIKLCICLVIEVDDDDDEATILARTSFSSSGQARCHVDEYFRLSNKEGEELPELPEPPKGMEVVRFKKPHPSGKRLEKPTTMCYTTPTKVNAVSTPYEKAGQLDEEGYRTVIRLMEYKA